MKGTSIALAAILVVLGCDRSQCLAWDYEAHRVVNQLAIVALPTNFPAFVKSAAARERIAFLAGEPDRWRNTPDATLQHFNNPDHYLDLEELGDYGLTPGTLMPFRYDFSVQLGLARSAHPDKFGPIDPEKNKDHTRELVGFLPWTITEFYAKLKSEFSYLKTFQQHGGTPEEIANAEANIIYTMGVMGHFVGDGSQPLHATKHHHGWVGDNPRGYSTNRTFHGWVDGGYFRKIGGINLESLTGKIKPAQRVGGTSQPAGFFNAIVEYLVADGKLVEPLYQLEKERKFSPRDGEVDAEGKVFLEARIVAGGQMLGNIWFSAWVDAPADKYLAGELNKRKAAQGAVKSAATGDSKKSKGEKKE